MKNLERHKNDLKALITNGRNMRMDLILQLGKEADTKLEHYEAVKKKCDGLFEKEYQQWYSESTALLQQVLPSRLQEFIGLYLPDPKRKGTTLLTYTLQDWFLGIRAATNSYTGEKHFQDIEIALSRFLAQLKILEATERRFESSLFDIQQLLRADLFDSELDAARELLKHKFLRGAGAIAGVVLEKHLGAICATHNISLKKGNPTISNFNDALKDGAAIEVSTWRFIQHLGDLRNLCDHGKTRDPNESEVADLIDGVAKISKTVA